MCMKNNMTLLVIVAMTLTVLTCSSPPRSRVTHCWGVQCSQSNQRVSSSRSMLGASMAVVEPSAIEEYNAWKANGEGKNNLPAAPVPSLNPPSPGSPPKEKSWQKATAEKGMGMMTQAGIYVHGIGVSASMSYELDLKAVTFEQVKKIMKDEHERLDGKSKQEFEKKWANGNAGLSGFWSFLGFNVGGGGGWESEQSNMEFEFNKDNKVNNVLRDIADLTESNMKIYGNVLIESKDDWPITVHAFVRVLHIEFTDDTGETKALKIIDSSNTPGAVQAGDESGDSSAVAVKNSNMKLLPLK